MINQRSMKLTKKQKLEMHTILINTGLQILATMVTMGIQILVTAGVAPKLPGKEKRLRGRVVNTSKPRAPKTTRTKTITKEVKEQ